ncbi:MAG: tetracycline resistance MFS efflux pump [Ignavibacteria bacterium CG22_combo_CG10-13_8_21_14_all_37_15]|nr:TCR/Tet family MFS transporter [Ignavibacteria bacterium]PIP77501.1 MAG: tetracycline resistance MFS efflux pump [Ignavibacteria bacterium CG22_combo_CG10-13_8_21_14_all_37_15]
MNGKKSSLSLIFLVVFVDLLGFGILIPILPTFAVKALQIPESAIGVILAVYSLVQFIFNPIFGSLSDKYGRRKIILVTLLLNASGYIIFAFTHSFIMLLLSRVVAGVGGSSIGVAQAYIADITTKEDRSKGMGLIGVAFGLGFVFGPIMGGLLSNFGYMVTGFAAAGFSFLAFSFSLFLLPESLTEEKKRMVVKRKIFDVASFKKVLSNPLISVVILLFFIVTFSVANIYGTFALLGHIQFGFTDMQNGMIFGIIGIIGAIVQGGLIGRLAKKYSDQRLITIGTFFLMIGLAFLPYGVNLTGVIIIAAIMSIGSGILQPILLSLVSKVAPENEQGIVLGVNQSFSSFARMLGPLWGGFSYQYLGYQIPFLTGAFFVLLVFLFSIFYLHNHLAPLEQKV